MSINYLKFLRFSFFKFFCYTLIFNAFNHWCFGESSKSYLKNINPDSLRLKSINAYRTTNKIEINGIMDLDEWAGSEVTSEFFQIDPKELAPPSEKTTARVM